VGITGTARDRFLNVRDTLFQNGNPGGEIEHVVTSDGREFSLRLDCPSERLLGYLYPNLLRHYRHSALYDVLAEYAGSQGEATTFVDIGANLGIYCLLASDLGYRTVAVEPEPKHVKFLERHAEYFDTICPVGVSDKRGVADFFVAGTKNRGASSLVAGTSGVSDSSIYDERIEVPVITPAELFADLPHKGSSIGLIKIDVEGHEACAVQGLTEYLEDGHHPPIWCEVRGPQSDRGASSYRDVSSVLTPYGYQPFRYEDGPVAFDPDTEELAQVFDLLFLSV